MTEYYRSNNTNPEWWSNWDTRHYDDNEDAIDTEWANVEISDSAEAMLDDLAESACGIGVGVSDLCQSYARNIRTHLKAAYLSGLKAGVV